MQEDQDKAAEKAAKGATFKDMAKGVGKAASAMAEKTKAVADKTMTLASQTKTAVFNAVDQNGDGEIGIDDVIIMGLKVPGVRIDRAAFLRKEYHKHLPKEVIEAAVEGNPMRAGVPAELTDRIAEEVIRFERNCVSGISAALGVPGGVAMVATMTADLAQYYGYMLRAAQKLMYLYGFPAIDMDENHQTFDTETINLLTVCLGVMYGAAGASNGLKWLAKQLAVGVEKKLLRRALTRGTIYPVVKSVAKWFHVKMTKQVFAGFFKKAIPVVGGVLGGGLTWLSFGPCCEKLRASLQNTMLSNPDYRPGGEDEILITDDDIAIFEEESADESLAADLPDNS